MNFFNKLFMFFCVSILLFGCAYEARKKETFARQIGTYAFDINRTELGEYKKDSNVYKNLRITFKDDSTFMMNMHAPFFADSLGKWIAGDGSPYDYNQLFYHNENDAKMEGEHFYAPYVEANDTIFLIVGALPMQNKTSIQKMYFRKLGR